MNEPLPEGRSPLLLAFYGDDFTGSTDVLEALATAGVRAMLFLRTPDEQTLRRYPDLQAFGVAGLTRTMAPEQIEQELPAALELLQRSGAALIHYKICSTFDSSPQIGSIGCALDIGRRIFNAAYVPVMAGAPVLGRYVIFGNLFARSGLDSDPYRLDRHPTMSRHPVTPMGEADLLLHLQAQTRQKIGLLDVLHLERGQAASRLEALRREGKTAVVLDVLYEEQLPILGEVLWQNRGPALAPFVIGSSGVEYALRSYWRQIGLLPAYNQVEPARPAAPVLIVSGTCSPVAERQMQHARDHGFAEVTLPTAQLVTPQAPDLHELVGGVVTLLKQRRSVILHTAQGPSDPRYPATVAAFRDLGWSEHDLKLRAGRVLGTILGQLLDQILARCQPARVVVAGGDTSSYVARTLGIEALEFIAPAAPGSPLCRAIAPQRHVHGHEIIFKGGQVGRTDFYSMLAGGERSHDARSNIAVSPPA